MIERRFRYRMTDHMTQSRHSIWRVIDSAFGQIGYVGKVDITEIGRSGRARCVHKWRCYANQTGTLEPGMSLHRTRAGAAEALRQKRTLEQKRRRNDQTPYP